MNETLPTQYQTYIHMSKYSRWRDDLGRREYWGETVDRYLDFWDDRFPGLLLDAERDKLRSTLVGLGAVPSMRCLMTAGKALATDEAAGYNCLGGDERFLTRDGLKTFREAAGTTQQVLAGDGTWRPAEIRSFGAQSLTKVTLRPGDGRSSVRNEILVTPDHRWLTINRGEVTDLRVGDVVAFNGAPREEPDEDAWIAGFGFGDGTIDARGCARVRLCGDKDMAHVDLFESRDDCSVYYPPSYNGDACVVFKRGVFTDWKELPHGKGVRYLQSWLDGYIAADGYVSDVQPGLGSQSNKAIEFVQEIAPLCGKLITGHAVSSVLETNFGRRKAPLQSLTIRETGHFRVVSIEDAGVGDVFCATEPVTASFTLASGALTGNCSYIAINRVAAWPEAMYLLMCGVGVGYSVETKYVNQLPAVPETLAPADEVVVVEDSKYGWAGAFRKLLDSLYDGKLARWDTSKVRPSGAVLKTFGGRASGPAPLEALFRHTVEVFTKARGRQLSRTECHSICCKIGDIVVVGGVRRSAMIALFSEEDQEMRNLKMGSWFEVNPHFGMANNSAVYHDRPSPAQLFGDFQTLIQSQAGEPGFFNRTSAREQASRWGKRPYDVDYGCNPCFSGDTLVAVADGRGSVRFDQLAAEGVDVPVYTLDNADNVQIRMMRNPRVTARGVELVEVELDDGQRVRCTPDHEFRLKDGQLRRASALTSGDSLHAMTRYQSSLDEIFGGRPRDIDYWWICGGVRKNLAEHRMIATFHHGAGSRTDVVHHADNNALNNHYQNLEWMSKADHDELHRTRMLGDLNPMRQPHDPEWWERYRSNMSLATSGERNGRFSGWSDEEVREHALILTRLCDRRFTVAEWIEYAKANGLPQSLSSRHRKRIGSVPSLAAWAARKCGFPAERRTGQRATLNHKVVAVRAVHSADVYNGTVDEFHNYFVGGAETLTASGKPKQQFVNAQNCGEIILRDRQLCNLSEVIARGRDTQQQLLDKIWVATVFGTLQSTLTNFKMLSPKWKKNCEEERLLGVSIAGIPDHALLNGQRGEKRLKAFQEEAREHVWQVNAEFAERLGVPPSAAATCLKPSGNTSQLTGAASPLKPHHAKKYVRRTRGSKNDPVSKLLVEQGVPYEEEAWHPDTTLVFEWPQKAPAGAATRHDWRALDQLKLWLMWRDNWCDHNPSVTVNVREQEWPDVFAWVCNHWDKMTGVTFLPDDDHNYVQAPYEEVDEERWNALAERMPEKIDWIDLSLYESEDLTTSARELACVSGACEIT